MASFLKNVLGNTNDGDVKQKPLGDDAGFADFAKAPEPEPASHSASTATLGGSTSPTSVPTLPYTKWYRVWERTSPADFFQEMIIIPFIVVMVAIHVFGKKSNKKRAAAWARHHVPALQYEFAQVGTSAPAAREKLEPVDAVKEVKPNQYITYATGRNNIAFLDVKIHLIKRYSPITIFAEYLAGFIFESIAPTPERYEAIAYSFDNKEAALVPRRKTDPEPKTSNSSYDGFVFAIVNKKSLRRLREDRYDLSLTTTKDHPKLPVGVTVLTESAEITDTLLTPELIKAVEDAGDLLDSLIISDQPLERPTKLNETIPRKRIALTVNLPSTDEQYINTLPLFTQYIRLFDVLVQHGRFRAEALRKVKLTREDEVKRIKKSEEEELAEERKTKQDKEKKEKRENLLKNMSASEQKKFLDREREKEMRKGQKRRTQKG